MRGTGWIIAILLIVLGVWYFGYYNDSAEAPEDRSELNDTQRIAGDLINRDLEIGGDEVDDTFYFSPATKFSVLDFDAGDDDLELDCDPEGAVATSTSEDGRWELEAVSEGTCRIEIGAWSKTITVMDDAR